MKKTVLVAMVLAAGGVFAGIVEETKSKPELAACVRVAPFETVTKKVTDFGKMINNPIVPTLLLSGAQENLTRTFGPMREDGAVEWFVYVQTPAWEVAATNDDLVALADLYDVAVVYPAAEGPAAMKLKHPGSTLSKDGVLHLLAGEDRPKDQWVKFAGDGRFCAFADSAALASRALADYAKRRVEPSTPLVRAELTARGVTALASLLDEAFRAQEKARAAKAQAGGPNVLKTTLEGFQAERNRRQLDRLRTFAGATLTIDLDEAGFVMDGCGRLKAGSRLPLGARLPAGALDAVAGNAPLFGCMNNVALSPDAPEDFRQSLTFAARILDLAVKELDKAPRGRTFAALGREISDGFAEFARDLPAPSPSDWCFFALGFDAQRHPCLLSAGENVELERMRRVGTKFTDRVLAALAKQWPGRKMIVRTSETRHVIDWAEVIDVVAGETGVETNAAQAVANAKRTVAAVLGDAKTEVVSTAEGTKFQSRVSAPGVCMTGAACGEARVAAALPEAKGARPAGVFYLSLYGLLRDDVLPIAAKVASKADAEQIRDMVEAMPAAQPNSAIAGGSWVGPDGSLRGVLRVTAGEIRNYGAAFNAYTAASMKASMKKGRK